MKNYEEMSMKELTAEYNKISHKNIKGFSTKAQAIDKLKELTTMYSSKPYKSSEPTEAIEKIQKCYSPKQVSGILNIPAIVIRRKLRKLYPDLAKQGSWKITQEMVEALR